MQCSVVELISLSANLPPSYRRALRQKRTDHPVQVPSVCQRIADCVTRGARDRRTLLQRMGNIVDIFHLSNPQLYISSTSFPASKPRTTTSVSKELTTWLIGVTALLYVLLKGCWARHIDRYLIIPLSDSLLSIYSNAVDVTQNLRGC